MSRKETYRFFALLVASLLAHLATLIVTDMMGDADGKAARLAGAIPLAAAATVYCRALWRRVRNGPPTP